MQWSSDWLPCHDQGVTTLFLMVGLPGAGKTTRAQQLAAEQGALRLTPDDWMIPLFGEAEADGKRDVLEGRMLWLALETVRLGTNVVVDFGCWSRDERSAIRWLVEAEEACFRMVYLPVDEDTFDWMFALNVRAAYMVSQAVACGMAAAGRGGAIVHMTSQMGHVGGPHRTVYCGTKHALEGMTKAMALELAPHGIRVNAVAPGHIVTPRLHDTNERVAFYAESPIPVKRRGQPSDIAKAVTFLASDLAGYVNGVALPVDGGLLASNLINAGMAFRRAEAKG